MQSVKFNLALQYHPVFIDNSFTSITLTIINIMSFTVIRMHHDHKSNNHTCPVSVHHHSAVGAMVYHMTATQSLKFDSNNNIEQIERSQHINNSIYLSSV